MKGKAIAVLLTVFCASCRTPMVGPRSDTARGDAGQPAMAGHYRFSTPDLRVDFDIRPDGTYHASMDGWGHVTEEDGNWRTEVESIRLQPRSGGLRVKIRRLGPVRQGPPGSLQIVEPDTDIGHAMVFLKE